MPNPNELAPLSVTPGAIRFNTDSMKLEYYRGGPVGFGTTTTTGEWVNLTTDSPDIQTGGARGVFGGGYGPSTASNNTIDYITISTTGNAIDFGDLVSPRQGLASCSSSTRGVFAGGETPVNFNLIDYITISSTGNATDFNGDLATARFGLTGLSNQTRGIFAGGGNPAINTIEYITIASEGQNTQDFGDLSAAKRRLSAVSSSTRGVFAGGAPSTNVIEFITISTLGNAADFGDLFTGRYSMNRGNAANSIRGLFAGGFASPAYVNTIEYITISTLGNAQDFGDLTRTATLEIGAAASSTRATFAGGGTGPGATGVNIIDYVTIMSVGNAIDFGDLTASQARQTLSGVSNGHGGLG
jgi:hypothetical protein